MLFFPYEHNIATTFPLSGKTFCRVSNFSVFKMYLKIFLTFPAFRFTPLATPQPETLPGKRDNVSSYEQNKIIWLVEMVFL
jgi:hypothetical protein